MEVLVYGAGALGSLVGGCWRGSTRSRSSGATRTCDGSARTGSGSTAIEAHVRPRALTDGTPVGRPRGGHDEGVRHGRGRAGARDRRVRRGLLASERVHGGAAGRGARPNRARGHRELRRPVHRARPGDLHRRRRGRRRGALGGDDPLAKRVGSAFDEAEIETTVATDMPRRRYEKLAVNAGINGPSALARLSNGRPSTGRVARRPARRPARSRGLRGPTGSRSTRTRRSTPSSAPPTPLPTGRR